MHFKEELVTYLTLGHIHVSKQDYQFFTNIIKINIEGQVTTGQDKLLNKLLEKYKKQLVRLGHDITLLQKLEWKKPLVETREDYKKAYLTFSNNRLIFKSPFSKKFISDLRNAGYSNTFKWDKTQKVYISSATTIALKTILKLAKRSFSELHVCDTLYDVLYNLGQYDKTIWNPTLIKAHGNFFVISCNDALNSAIAHITLNDDPKTLFELTKYGLNFDETIVKSEIQKFATSHYYETDSEHVYDIIDYIQSLGVTEVAIESQALYSNTLYKDLRNKFIESGIDILSYNDSKNTERGNYPILISFKTKKYVEQYFRHVSKIVSVKNSTPIDVK